MKDNDFKVYDIVSRMGKDEQIVTNVDDICITVLCIKPGGCFKIGDEEYNLQRRYSFVRHCLASDIPTCLKKLIKVRKLITDNIMENKLRLNAETKDGKFDIDIYSPIGEMFIIAIVPPNDENNNDKRYISWAICEHHQECNGVAIWHIQTLHEYRKKGWGHKLILALKCKHEILETNYETTNDDGYLFLIKEEFKVVKNLFKNDKNRKVLQWKKTK